MTSYADALANLSPEKRALLSLRLKKKAQGAQQRIPRRPDPAAPAPLSFAQERLWFLSQFEAGAAYNDRVGFLLHGPLDLAAFAASFDAIRHRHEVLRTVYPDADGRPAQVILPWKPMLPPLVDLSGLRPEARAAEADRLAFVEGERPFLLESEPGLRVMLLRHAAGGEGEDGEQGEHALLVTLHHIVTDGWSWEVLLREFALHYEALAAGRPPALPELPIQYADFAVWQREPEQQEALAEQAAWWKARLAGAPPVLDLPTDRPRPARQTFHGVDLPFELPAAACEALRELCRGEEATFFMGLLAVFQALLGRYARQEDVLVGSPVAGRGRPETEPLIGVFVNTLVLRGDLAGDPTFRELLGRVRRTALDAFSHQDVPFERLVESLGVERNLSHSPLFQVLLVVQNTGRRGVELPSLRVSPLHLPGGAAKLDLELAVVDRPGSVAGSLELNTDLFDLTTAWRLLRRFAILLEEAAGGPERRLSELPFLSAEERFQVLVEWNDTRAGGVEGLVHELVAAQASRAPGAPAVVGGGRVLTYGELESRANRLAHHLRRLGAGAESLVGLSLDRSPELVVALLAVLKAGAAYLPLDPSYPAERLSMVLEDARPPLLLTERNLAAGLFAELPHRPERMVVMDGLLEDLAAEDGAPPAVSVLPGQLAYVLFTSGSTGRPKGVEIPHGALANFLESMRRQPGLAAGEGLLAVTSLSFDIAALELFLPLLVGGRIELASREEAVDGALLAARLAAGGVAAMQATPATWRMLLESGWPGTPGLVALCGGEALPRALAEEVAGAVAGAVAGGGALWNLYGPTETTVWSAVCRAGRAGRAGRGSADPVPVGRPIANTRIHLLDPTLRPVPIGVPGELYIGGTGVARGYRGRPDLTAERFVPDPCADGAAGERLYRTGDLARHLADGTLEFLGRVDHQVKVRGFRVELGEIEAALAGHPGVAQAAVVLRRDGAAVPYLAAYLVPAGGAAPAAAELRAFLAGKLPDYMVPSLFEALAEMPLTPNRKVDRRALPAPAAATIGGGIGGGMAPRTPVEEVLAGIWGEVLGVERVGPLDGFFDLGGHSLLATRVMARVRSAFGVDLPLRALFEAPALAAFAARVERARSESAAPAPPLRPVARQGALPLSFAQRRLWFLQQLEPDNPAFNIPTAVALTGRLDAAALAAAFAGVARRHETLRTTFHVENDEPVQAIGEPSLVPLPLVDLAALPEEAGGAEVRRLRRDHALRPMSLERGPVIEVALLRLKAEEHVLLATLHHIVSDGWSQGVLVSELAELYRAAVTGTPCRLAPLPVQYADYAVWQRQWLAGEVLEAQLSWWRERLAGAPPRLDLTGGRPRPALPSFRGAVEQRRLPEELAAGLRAAARRGEATLFMTLAAAFQVLLHERSGQEDIVVGSDVVNRDRVELEGLIGFFVNQLPLRVRLDGDPTFPELLAQAREMVLGAHAHRDLPFEKLVEVLRPERDLGYAPLFQVKLNLHNLPSAVPETSGLALHPLPGEREVSQLDLILNVLESPHGLDAALEYSTDLFERDAAAALLEDFERILGEVCRRPEVRLSGLRAALAEAGRERKAREEAELEAVRLRTFRRGARRAVKESATS